MTEWYRRQTEELRAKQEYDEERERTKRPHPADQPGGLSAMPKPWEGISEIASTMGINLGELWQSREKELTEARQAASERDRELHELRLREIDRRVEDLQKLATATSEKVQGGNGQGGHRSRMDEAIDNLIASRIDTILGGNQQRQLTAEDIKEIATKAVQEGTQRQQTPQQIVESLMGFITAAETAKQRMAEFGGAGNGSNPYLTQAGNMRSDILKIFLENDRETLRMNHEYEIQKERNKHLGSLAGAVKDNIEDFIGASRDMSSVVKERRQSGQERPLPSREEGEGGYQVKCSLCGATNIFPEKPKGLFECPSCHGKLKLQESSDIPSMRGPGIVGLEF